MAQDHKLKVLIVGAGSSGLLLALLLEIAGIDYVLLEKKPSFLPPSRACVLTAVVLPLLEQLGFLEEIEAISLPARKFTIKRHDRLDETIGEFDATMFKERYGYSTLVLPRPAFYNVLLRGIPKQKILLGKRVLSSTQSHHGVLVRCADGSTYSGDILVGADGANSAVRQNLYRQLELEKRAAAAQAAAVAKVSLATSLLVSHSSPHAGGSGTGAAGATSEGEGGSSSSFSATKQKQTKSSTKSSEAKPHRPPLFHSPGSGSLEDEDRGGRAWTVMGITQPLDASKYPELGRPYSDFIIVMGNKNKESFWCMPTANRRLQWSITTPIDKSDVTMGDVGFKTSEYGPEAIEKMYSKYRHYSCPYGGTMADIFEQSPQALMSKVLVQEKIYDVWQGQRTLLMGN
ncbi:hypothetical protein BGZ83_010045, partial [Gryganskiella cystojenkinii]